MKNIFLNENLFLCVKKKIGLICWMCVQEEDGCTMLQVEKNNRTRLEVMKEQKKQRMTELKALIVKDRELCDIMCTPSFDIDQNAVPSLKQLETYRAYLEDLTKQKVILAFCTSLI